MEDLLDYEESILEDFDNDPDSDESDDSDERSRRRRRPRTKTPSGQGLYRGRPSSNSVTQAQLQTALTRVGQQIKEGSTATQQLASRVNTLVDRLDKEVVTRKKADTEQKKASGNASMGMMLPLLLMQGGGTEISDKEGEKRQKVGVVERKEDGTVVKTQIVEVLDSNNNPTKPATAADVVTQNTKFKSSSSSDMMLPLVMMMSMGGMSGGGSGGDNNMMMMMMVMLMMQKK